LPDVIIDPLEGPPFGLHGRIVTMDADHTILPDATVWVEAAEIRAVTKPGEPIPDGFGGAPVIRTGGTVFPGMIELHNHLPYNVLQMWQVPALYGNRGQWGDHDDYRRLVSGPMKILGRTAGYIESVVRYVEVKALVAGVTTSQGVALYSNSNTRRYHRGLVRNVEETNDDGLPEADSRVADIDADGAAAFLARLEKGKRIILHLAEGVDDTARSMFTRLLAPSGRWAITDALVGIHLAALIDDDFAVMGDNHGSMVWSPASNLMLYGDTARIDLARRSDVAVALGSDWSPTGSKNLLAELKVARAVSDAFGWGLADGTWPTWSPVRPQPPSAGATLSARSNKGDEPTSWCSTEGDQTPTGSCSRRANAASSWWSSTACPATASPASWKGSRSRSRVHPDGSSSPRSRWTRSCRQ
jgi:5-methylthioadenosine/S-adenosylhomocysteine deaminase